MGQESAKISKRMRYSNVIACALGIALVVSGGVILLLGRNPLEDVPYHIVVAVSCLLFGVVLWVWVLSGKRQWIGIDTVNLLIGVIVAVIAISAFAKQIERQPSAPSSHDSR